MLPLCRRVEQRGEVSRGEGWRGGLLPRGCRATAARKSGGKIPSNCEGASGAAFRGDLPVS